MQETENCSENPDSGIDLQAALAMAGGDVGLLRELAGAYLDEVPRLLSQLHTSVEQRNPESLKTVAHQLQGVMRCLHIGRAVQQAREFEHLAEAEPDWSVAASQLATLTSTIDSATQALRQFLSERI